MLSVITPSTVESVSVAEVKVQARIDTDAEDDLIAAYIPAARSWCEAYVSRPLTGSAVSYRLSLDSFCDPRYYHKGVIYLPVAPVLATTGISYLPSDGSTTTVWDSSNYTLDTYSEPGRVALVYGAVYPPTLEQLNAVTIPFTAGYSTTADVPQGCRTAIKMLAAHWYEHREPVITGTIVADVPFGLQALLDPHKWSGYL